MTPVYHNVSDSAIATLVVFILGTLGSLGYIIFRIARVYEKVEQLYSNHLPHIEARLNKLEDLIRVRNPR